jgi:cob(I)alamin adenosyltransferase
MKIYTGKGDDGTTSLAGGRRVSKHHVLVEAYGTIDELISWVGLIRDHKENSDRKNILIYIQDQLMRAAATIASDPEKAREGNYLPEENSVQILEKEIDKIEEELQPLDGFILPGGNVLISYCHITRCVCRRAERRVIKAAENEKIPEVIIIFLNRLSDYLFVLSRKIRSDLGNEEIRWSV